MNKSKLLKELLLSKETLVMPDAYDPISARIIEYLGFKAVQCSGYSFSIAACKKEETDVSFEENLLITSKIINAVSIPVMADGEDGFGGAEQIASTIEKYIKIGTAGINIEDQILFKISGSKVIDPGVMQQKIKIAKNTAREMGIPEFIVNGRTDALGAFNSRTEGLKESAKRANLYLEAGADIVFVTKVATLDEAKCLVKEINGPLSIAAGLPYNINNFSINDLKEIGVARVSLPTIAIQAAIKAIMNSVELLKTGELKAVLTNHLLCSGENIDSLTNI